MTLRRRTVRRAPLPSPACRPVPAALHSRRQPGAPSMSSSAPPGSLKTCAATRQSAVQPASDNPAAARRRTAAAPGRPTSTAGSGLEPALNRRDRLLNRPRHAVGARYRVSTGHPQPDRPCSGRPTPCRRPYGTLFSAPERLHRRPIRPATLCFACVWRKSAYPAGTPGPPPRPPCEFPPTGGREWNPPRAPATAIAESRDPSHPGRGLGPHLRQQKIFR